RSIKTQLMISFFAVMLPVVMFLVANNWYAKTVVRDKVSETYRNTLDIFVGHMDSTIDEINQYLFKLAANDTDIGLLNSYKVDSDQYMLTKIRIQNKINRDVGFYNLIHTVFIYREDDIIFSTIPGEYSPVKQLLFEKAPRMVAQHRMMQDGHWVLWQDDLMRGRDFLVRVAPAESGLYVGAFINIGDILDGLRVQWDKDKIGESAVYRREGVRITEPLSFTDPNLPLANLSLVSEPYQVAEDKANGKKYLVMIRSSENADLAISVAVPESTMLQGLPYFQRVVYFIAF